VTVAIVALVALARKSRRLMGPDNGVEVCRGFMESFLGFEADVSLLASLYAALRNFSRRTARPKVLRKHTLSHWMPSDGRGLSEPRIPGVG
jgi:hypothetical protein